MNFNRRSADFPARVRACAVLIVAGALVFLSTSCNNSDASGSGCIAFPTGTAVDFSETFTGGFDDFSSPGAALGVAVDEIDPNIGLIIAMRFSGVTTEETFKPTCDTATAIDTYDFAELNNVTEPIAMAYPFLAQGLTDTNGISLMSNAMNALLFVGEAPSRRFFLAVDGRIFLQRDLANGAEMARVTGNLKFAEITAANSTGEILSGGQVFILDDIDFTWDTFIQPID
jgi:hypothetical protein